MVWHVDEPLPDTMRALEGRISGGDVCRSDFAVIGDGSEPLKGWHRTLIPARIASLVQHFADRDTPMAPKLGQKLLRILDLLVDMGDRRSAALQLSESFREIKIA